MQRRTFIGQTLCLGLMAPLGAVAAATGGAVAQTSGNASSSSLIRPAAQATLDEFTWLFRPIIVFADTTADPRFAEQIDWLRAEIDELAKRDVIVLTDTEPAAKGPLRQKLRPHGFQLVLVGKDGRVLLRKPAPWTVREITRSIDKRPIRQREVEERRGS